MKGHPQLVSPCCGSLLICLFSLAVGEFVHKAAGEIFSREERVVLVSIGHRYQKGAEEPPKNALFISSKV